MHMLNQLNLQEQMCSSYLMMEEFILQVITLMEHSEQEEIQKLFLILISEGLQKLLIKILKDKK